MMLTNGKKMKYYKGEQINPYEGKDQNKAMLCSMKDTINKQLRIRNH